MSQRFNLTAQLQLQAPTNVNQVVGQIRRQLQGVAVNVQVQGNTRNLAAINRQMQNVRSNANGAAQGVGNLNRNLAEAARRFSVITVATGTMLAFARSIKDGVGEAIAFERELVKISQVTGKTVKELQGLTREVTRLSTGLGASSADLLNVSRTLAQAGFSAQKTKQALDILAKTSLAATFDSIQDTTEGAIAVLNQFRKEARQSGGDIKFLEQTLDAINSVSKKFAVESGDLITVIRRVGGVFETAGGSVNELIALFTSVRATTRESAETIATGLRTIFTRIQRTDTVDQLKALGIELRNSQGQFVGAFEAVRRLSTGLSALDPRDYRFSEIVESLGGFRQIGKVIPLIRQFRTAQEALNVAQAASGSVARDAATAQQSLQVQAGKVAEEFRALMRTFADSSTFRSIATGALELARAFIRIAESLEPLLPMLGLLAGLKIGRGVAPLLGGLLAGGGARGVRGISRFASGGYVPGSGNRDTVPAMLTPGEFVIKKSSAKKLGPATLSAMNNNRYAAGGPVSGIVALRPFEEKGIRKSGSETISRSSIAKRAKVQGVNTGVKLGRILADPKQSKRFTGYFGTILKSLAGAGSLNVRTVGAAIGDDTVGSQFEGQITKDFVNSVNKRSATIGRFFNSSPSKLSFSDAKNLGIESVVGNAFEAALTSLGTPFSGKGGNNAAFDFVNGLGANIASKLKVGALANNPTDAKRTLTSKNLKESATKKFLNQLATTFKTQYLPERQTSGKYKEEQLKNFYASKRKAGLLPADFARGGFTGMKKADFEAAGFEKRFNKWFPKTRRASGGSISGSDRVPALLTPGEYVVNKSAAQSIGYSNLNSMNTSGVARFQNGGIVGLAGAGGSGARAFRGMGQAGMSQFARENDAAARQITRFARTTSEAQAAMVAYSRAILAGQNQQQALHSASRAATLAHQREAVSTDRLDSAIQQETQELQNSRPGQTRTSRFANARNSIAQFGATLDPIAGAAQSFVFAGVMAGTLATQFSGLSEETKRVITEVSGFTSTIVGLGGTILQVFTSMTAAMATNTQAGIAAAAADNTEAAASLRAAGGLSAVFLAVTGTVLATVVTFKYFQARASAAADKFEKAADELLKKIQTGGAGVGFVDTQANQIAKQLEAQAATRGMLQGGGRGAALSGAAGLGALAIGFSGPVGIAAALLAGVGAFVISMEDFEEEVKTINSNLQFFATAIRNSANGLIEVAVESARLARDIADIDRAKYDPERDIQERLAAAQRVGRQIDFSGEEFTEGRTGALGQTGGQYGSAQMRLAAAALATGQLDPTEASFEGDPVGLANFKNATAAVAIETKNLADRVKLTTQALDRAFELDDVKGGQFTYDQLIKNNKTFADAIEASEKSLRLQSDQIQEGIRLRIETAQALVREKQQRGENTEQLEQSIQTAKKQQQEEISALARRIAAEDDANRRQVQAYGKNREALIAAAAAADEFRKRMDRAREFGAALATEEARLRSFGQSLSNAEAILNNTSLNLSNPVSGLENLTEIEDLTKFTQDLNRVVANVPARMQAAAQESVDSLVATATLFTEGRKNVLDAYGKEGQTPDFVEFLKTAGIQGAVFDSLPDEIQDDIFTKFSEAFTDNLIKDTEFRDIFSGLAKEMQASQSNIKRSNDIINSEIQLRQKMFEQQESIMQRQIDADAKVIDASIQGAEALAEAMGQELSFAQKRAARTQQAQINLRGTNLMAGDARGAANLIRSNRAEIKAIENKVKATGKATDAELERLAKLQSSTKKATDELNRLADRSEDLSDLQAEIAKQQDIRESISNIFEDFAFGGLQERRDILAGVGGIRAAIATGTVQNQSQAQRALTRQMLDALADVPIGPGGETGEQIKKFLAANDLMNMGLISRQQRDAILNATSVEEQLIIELRKLTQATIFAATQRALAQFANGGYMSGPSHARGGIPIEVEGGEYVIRKSVVRQRGKAFFDRLNSGSLPKFQGGGGTSPPSLGKKILERERLMAVENDLHRKEIQRLKKIHGFSDADAISSSFKGRMRTATLESQAPGGRQSFPRKGLTLGPDIKNFGRVANKVMGKLDLVGTTAEVMTSDYVRPGVEGAGGVLTAQGIGTASILKSLFMGTDITKGLAESAVASERRGRDAGSVNRGQGGFITGSSYAKVLNPDEVIGTGAATQTGTLNAAAVFSEFFLGGGSGASGPTNIKELLAQQAGPSEAAPFKDVKDLNRTLAGMTGPIEALKNAFLAGEITQKQFTDTLKTHETKVFGRLNASEGPLKRQRTAVSDRIRSKFSSDQTISQKAAADEAQMRAEQKVGEKRQAESIKRRMGEETASGMVLTEDGYRYPGMEKTRLARRAARGLQTTPSFGTATPDDEYAAGRPFGSSQTFDNYLQMKPADQKAYGEQLMKERRHGSTDDLIASNRQRTAERRKRMDALFAKTPKAPATPVPPPATPVPPKKEEPFQMGGIFTPAAPVPKTSEQLRKINPPSKSESRQAFSRFQRMRREGKDIPKNLEGIARAQGFYDADVPKKDQFAGTGKTFDRSRKSRAAIMQQKQKEAEKKAKAKTSTTTPRTPAGGLFDKVKSFFGFGAKEQAQGASVTSGLKSRAQILRAKAQQQGGMERYRGAGAPGGVPGVGPAQFTPFSERSRPRAFTPMRVGASGRVSGGQEFRNAGYVARQDRFDKFGIDPRVSRQGGAVRDAMMQATGYSSANAANRAAEEMGLGKNAGQVLAQNRAQDQFQQQQQQQQAAGGGAPGAQTMDKLSGIITQLETNFQNIVEKFSTLEHNHTFNGEIGIQVNIGNKEEIVNAVRNMIEGIVQDEVTDIDSTGNAGGGGGNGG